MDLTWSDINNYILIWDLLTLCGLLFVCMQKNIDR